MYAYMEATASKRDPPRRRTPPIRYEGEAVLAFDPFPLGGLAPSVDEGAGDDGAGDPTVGVLGVTDDGDGDWTVGVLGVPDDGDGAGEDDGAVPLLFEVAAAATVIVSFMPAEQ